ncbi:MAG: DUF2726 domain-containing protein, partial [Methylocella sp.]
DCTAKFTQGEPCGRVGGCSMSGLKLGDGLQVEMLVFIALAMFIVFMVACTSGFVRRPRWHHSGSPYRTSGFEQDQGRDLQDLGQQLHAVMAASFGKRRVLSYSEYQAFKIIEEEMTAAQRGHRVFAQTSLGEILQSASSDAFRSINCKRVDILVVDQGGRPVLAIEYQGSGHYQGTAAARDAIKKEALRKAGVRYIEVSATDSDDQIRSRVREQLGWKTAASMNCVSSPSGSASPARQPT